MKEFQAPVSKENLAKFIEEYKYERPDSYAGETFEGYVVVVSQHRDSEALDRSNYSVAIKLLQPNGKDVISGHFGHWAVGWAEQIFVKFNSPKINIAYNICKALKDYPILDESDFPDLEWSERVDYADSKKESVARTLIQAFSLPESLLENKNFLSICMELNIECQSYYGDDSCVMSNQYHADKMNHGDIERYIECLEQVESNSNILPECKNELELLKAHFGMSLKEEV